MIVSLNSNASKLVGAKCAIRSRTYFHSTRRIRPWRMDNGFQHRSDLRSQHAILGGLACVAESLAYIQSLGVDAIVRHRKPLIDHLRAELPKRGFTPLTPPDSAGPIVVFSYQALPRASANHCATQIFKSPPTKIAFAFLPRSTTAWTISKNYCTS